MRLRFALTVLALFALLPSACAQWTPLHPITKITKEADGVRAAFQSGEAWPAADGVVEYSGREVTVAHEDH